jgi:hypothetical protein
MRAQGGLSRGQCDAIQKRAQVQRGVRLKPEFVQKDGLVPFPADEQRLGGQAGRRPAFDKGIKIRFRVNAQNENGQRMVRVRFVENGNHHRQIDTLVVLVPVEILKRHLTGPQNFWNAS